MGFVGPVQGQTSSAIIQWPLSKKDLTGKYFSKFDAFVDHIGFSELNS